jgi:hypothetical protein
MQLFQYYTKTLMKYPYPLLTALLLCISVASFSQKGVEVIRQQSCSDQLISKQVDSLKQLYGNDGYVLLREASVSMESEFEMPVIMPLNEGSWYQFIFLGEKSSKLYEVRMYDWNEKMVIYRKNQWGDVDGNIITYSYIPKFSEYHMMKPLQVNKGKKKNLCGYVMLFKKVKDQNASPNP